MRRLFAATLIVALLAVPLAGCQAIACAYQKHDHTNNLECGQ